MLRNDNTCLKWWLAPNALRRPGELLIKIAGLLSHTFWPHGLDAISRAFFNDAGYDLLCSGVTKTNPSYDWISFLNESYTAGFNSGSSKSWL